MGEAPVKDLTSSLRHKAVKKHVAAIHVSGKMTLLQRKMSNVLLLNAYDTLQSQSTHHINARTLCAMIGYNSNDMDTLKQSLRCLTETVAEWDILDEMGRQEWGVSSLLSYASLKDGVCEYAYSPALANKLHDPKIFAMINLNIQRGFTSGRALTLYENCFRFIRTGSTGWWSLDLFRRLIGLDESIYYESYKHLNAKVIKPAVAEVNKTSNILIEMETRKRGKVVTDVRFLIRENPQMAILDLDDGTGIRHGPVYARLREHGVSDRLARQWLSTHGEDHVAAKLDYVEQRKHVRSMVGYLNIALQEDYRDTSNGGVALKSKTPRNERLRRMQTVINARTPTQRDADKRLFMSQIKNEAGRADFERYGWVTTHDEQAVYDFWEKLFPEIFEGIRD